MKDCSGVFLYSAGQVYLSLPKRRCMAYPTSALAVQHLRAAFMRSIYGDKASAEVRAFILLVLRGATQHC